MTAITITVQNIDSGRHRALSRSRTCGRPVSESPEHEAKKSVAPRRLPERAGVVEERRHPGCTALRMGSVHEVAERVEGDVLAECHGDGERSRSLRPTAARVLVGEPKERTVEEVDGNPGGPPAATASNHLAEHCDVGVVAPEHKLVNSLLERPHGRRNKACEG